MTNSEITIVLIDDHDVVRRGLRTALEDGGYSIVGEAASKKEAFAQIAHKKPDVIVVDISLPDGNGLEIVTWARGISQTIGIVVLTLHDDDDHLLAALQAGASAFILKTAALHEVVSAVSHSFAAPMSFSSHNLQGALSRKKDGFGLTARELQVLSLIPSGKTSTEIGLELFITEATVKTHLASIYRKLAVANRIEAVGVAMKNKLVD